MTFGSLQITNNLFLVKEELKSNRFIKIFKLFDFKEV
jgi:hypothetical protein